MRAEFEEWLQSREVTTWTREGEGYKELHIHFAWRGWSAAWNRFYE